MNECWEIEEGKINSSEFFKLLLLHFTEATTVYIEGTSIDKNVIKCYKNNFEEGKYLPEKQTYFPISKKYRCKFTENFINELILLTNEHAEPEIMDHLFIYKNLEPLLEWHDAFSNAILITNIISEKTVSAIATNLGLKYGKAKFRC